MDGDICIICRQSHQKTTIEHIVPHSLGNEHYILRNGLVCRNCNNRFAKYEHQVVSSAPFLSVRRKYGKAPKTEITPTTLTTSSLRFFLMKIGYESIHKSRPKLLSKYNLENIRLTLAGQQNGFKNEQKVNQGSLKGSQPIPKLIDRWRLKSIGVRLNYKEEHDALMFNFIYGHMSFWMVLR